MDTQTCKLCGERPVEVEVVMEARSTRKGAVPENRMKFLVCRPCKDTLFEMFKEVE